MAISDNESCFDTMQEAVRISVKYMTPVIVLSDSYLANNSSIFKIPEIDKLNKIALPDLAEKDSYKPYLRNQKTLARGWATP
jgi:2-oxoglutarate/2-oxoacid ferredoxin oxidoreductase subunit alpha